jgi:hypothetical protein
MRYEWFGSRPSRDRLQDRRFDFYKAAFLQEAPGFTHNSNAFFEHGAGTLVSKEIEITLPIARLDVL